MKLFLLEVKRMFRIKRVCIIFILSFLISILMAYLPITFESINIIDENGNSTKLNGIEAVEWKKEMQKAITGVVTSQNVRMAVEECQKVFYEYDVHDYYELPDDVYVNRILPFVPLIKGVREIYADPDTGIAPDILGLCPEEVENYYTKCDEWIVELMRIEQKDNAKAQNFAVGKYNNVDKPYIYYPGITRNAMDYQVLLAFVLLILSAVIAAPVFSNDYQTGANEIFRSTKHGHKYFGNIRNLASIIICSSMFLICMAIYLLISNTLFGWESTKTSVQILYSIVSLPNLNIGEMQIAVVFLGLISVCASVALNLLFSAVNRNVIVSLSLGFLLCIMPLLVYIMFPDKIEAWINCILPSGGLCPQMGYLYSLVDFQFLTFGKLVVWRPYLMIVFAIVEVPIFWGATIYSYVRYKE